MRTAEYPRPRYVLAQLSDLHLRDPADPLVRGRVDPRPKLAAALTALAAHSPDALLCTGDLSDDGTTESYIELRSLIEPVAEALNAKLIWGNGNHDSREAFAATLLDQAATVGPLNQVHHVGGLRVLWLDTTVPGADHGEVADASLGWLAEQLSQPAEEGTILGLHHTPLPVVQDLAASWELIGQRRLAALLASTDVRAIVGGHFHQSAFGTFAGIPVHAATSLAYTQDLATGRGMRGQDGAQAWHLISVHADTITSTVAPIGEFASVTEPRSAAASAEKLAERGVRIAD